MFSTDLDWVHKCFLITDDKEYQSQLSAVLRLVAHQRKSYELSVEQKKRKKQSKMLTEEFLSSAKRFKGLRASVSSVTVSDGNPSAHILWKSFDALELCLKAAEFSHLGLENQRLY